MVAVEDSLLLKKLQEITASQLNHRMIWVGRFLTEGKMSANVLTNNLMGERSLGGMGVNVFEMGLNVSANHKTREFGKFSYGLDFEL